MPQFQYVCPVLPAQDIAQTVAFYVAKMGFTAVYDEADYGIVERDGVQIHFWLCPDRSVAEQSSCRITAVGIQPLYDEAQQQGIVHPNGALATKPWGLREFAVLDPNGNLIWLVEELDEQA